MCGSCREMIEAYQETISDNRKELDCLHSEIMILKSKISQLELERDHYMKLVNLSVKHSMPKFTTVEEQTWFDRVVRSQTNLHDDCQY